MTERYSTRIVQLCSWSRSESGHKMKTNSMEKGQQRREGMDRKMVDLRLSPQYHSDGKPVLSMTIYQIRNRKYQGKGLRKGKMGIEAEGREWTRGSRRECERTGNWKNGEFGRIPRNAESKKITAIDTSF